MHKLLPLRRHAGAPRPGHPGKSGQSLAEFALLLPVFLLIVLVTIDFGRAYLGWINLQQIARAAANYAANNRDGWEPPGDAAKQGRYQEIVANEAQFINCALPPGGVPDPAFTSGFDLGDLVEVSVTCQFSVITPIVSQIVGGQVLVTASATMPVKTGVAGGVGGGGGVIPAPVAEFVASPRSGYAPLTVDFVDASTNVPTSWIWSFGDGFTDFSQDPTHDYTTAGLYSVVLTVQNAGGFDSETKVDWIEVLDPPTSGPIPEFTASPRAGNDPLDVAFTDLSTGGATTWTWNFGDGTPTSSQQNPNHTYTATGKYDVTLTVSDGTTSNLQTKTEYILVNELPCRVPSFIGTRKNGAQNLWDAAGFTGNISYQQGNGNYIIQYQSEAGGSIPLTGCAADITVGP